MPSSTVCWGIEVGAAGIKAVKLEAAGDGRVKVLEWANMPHPKPLSTPGADANDILRVSLGAFVNQYDLSKAAIAVSVPGHSAFARFAKLPPVDPKKVPDIVKFEAMQQIPFPLDQVEWDYQTFVSPDSPEVEVGIFAITKERVNERLMLLADVGINPSFVVLSPISVYNALSYDLEFNDKTPGTIIVDVGTTSTDLVVAVPGRMWVRTFPIGGHQFTQALVDQFQLSYPKAEKLKREAEDSRHARQVFQAMRPVFTDLAQDIQRSIGYYQSLNRDAQLTRLIGIGATFHLPGLRKYLKQQLSMDVYRIEEFKKAPVAEGGADKSAAFNAISLELCTAYGLALHGLGLNSVSGNLMPTGELRKAMWKEKVPWFGIAASVAAVAGAAMFVRPIRDHFAVGGTVPDPIIQTSLRRFSDLKSEAEQAGVTTSGEPDYRAANMLALLDKRDTYERIVGDVTTMLADAQKRAINWESEVNAGKESPVKPGPGPAFSLSKLETNYMPGASPDGESGAPRIGGGSGPEPSEVTQYPRIQCRATFNTTQPEARRFARETIQQWLAANGKREGVDYVIMAASVNVTDGRSSSASGSAGSGAEAPIAAGGAASPVGGKGRGFVPSGGNSADEDERLKRELDEQRRREISTLGGPVVGGGSAPPVERGGNAQKDAAAADNLNKLAPLIKPVETGPAPSVVNATWYVVFLPEQPADAPK